MQASNDPADTKFARYGQFQEKEKTPTTELNTFSTENNKEMNSLGKITTREQYWTARTLFLETF